MKKVSPIIHCSMAEVKMAPILNVVLRRHKTEQKRAAPCERKIKNDLPSSAVGQHLVKNRNFDEILKKLVIKSRFTLANFISIRPIFIGVNGQILNSHRAHCHQF